nr:PREDICTED: uncharacterized protein LOC104151109 [Struthio camelus australis]
MSSRFSLNWLLLILFTGPTVSGSVLKGVVGQDITLPCSYRVKKRTDITTMCWGRDACPSSKCLQTIIWTDGWKVTQQSSKRYSLKGKLSEGDVSLTIANAEEADSGTYCCRVEIPGLFNDQLTNYRVVIEKARITTPSPHTYTSEQTSAPGFASDSSFTVTTWPSVSGSEAPQTAYDPCSSTNFTSDCSDLTTDLQNVSVSAHSSQYSENGIYVGIGICVVLLVILILAVFLSRHYLHNMKKLNNFPSSVTFWRSERAGNQNALEVEMHAEENIYTIRWPPLRYSFPWIVLTTLELHRGGSGSPRQLATEASPLTVPVSEMPSTFLMRAPDLNALNYCVTLANFLTLLVNSFSRDIFQTGQKNGNGEIILQWCSLSTSGMYKIWFSILPIPALKSPSAEMSHLVLFHWILIQTFVAHATSDTVVRGEIGRSVTLPCFYQVARWKDISDMCWGKGKCPNSKCNNKILHTTGNRVTFRKSQRYSLQGFISYGDVSLTIKEVKEEDAGIYCCRIEIPGWFNDIKRNMKLEVVRATTVPATTRLQTTKLTLTLSASPVMTTAMATTHISPPNFTKTVSVPQATSDLQATVMAETVVLLTTVSPPATTATEIIAPPILVDPPATTEPPEVIMLETFAPPTFTMAANDIFPEIVVTSSAPVDFSTGFQAADMNTEGDYVFGSTEFVTVPEVTAEFPSTLPSSEGTENANASLITEDGLTTDILGSSNSKAKKNDDNIDQFPAYVVLITCLIVASILFILMLLSLLWKCKHTRSFITKSPGPPEELEKVFSGAEGENGLFVL